MTRMILVLLTQMMMMMMVVVVNSLVIPSHHSIPYRSTTAFTTFPTSSSSSSSSSSSCSNRIRRTWSSVDGQHVFKLHPPRRSPPPSQQQSRHFMTMMMMMMIEYTEEGKWDDAFIQEQIALVPPVQTVHELPEPLSFHRNHNHNHIQYYLLRHGQSTANVAEVISSDRFTLSYTEKHGLTELGKQQATASAQSLLRHMLLLQENHPNQNHPNHHHRLIFVTSPFARARQTALACYHGIQDLILPTSNGGHPHNIVLEIRPSILIHNALVERYFGIYDNDILDTYGYVWPLDQINVTQTINEVESVAAVATRISTFLRHMDQYIMTHYDHNNNNNNNNNITTTNHVVLVSHGDVVQIAQLYAANVSNIGEFSSYRFQSMC